MSRTLKKVLFSALFLALGGTFNAPMDKLQFHYEQSIFSNWNNKDPDKAGFWDDPRKESWKRKYKNQDQAQGPAFFLSTTLLVFLTDAWHLFQTLMFYCFSCAVAGVALKRLSASSSLLLR